MTETPWMDVRETAEYMRISQRHVHRLKDSGLEHGRTGKKLVFHKDKVDDYMRDKGKKP